MRAAAAAGVLLSSLLARTASADLKNWRYSTDYEGEDRSHVGWSPDKIQYRGDDGALHDSSVLVSARISWTLPAFSFAHDTPRARYGEQLFQALPSLGLSLTQITQHSSAVLPPSFNPRVLRFAFRERWWPDDPKRQNGRELAFGFIGTIWSHHSDGQYGATYFDAAGNPTDDLANAASTNRDNGDFATNYLGAKGWFRRSRLDDNNNRPARGFFVGLEYQYHHGKIFPGGLSPKLEPIWGRHHVLLSAHYRTGYQHDPLGDVAPSDSLGGSYWLVGLDAWRALDAADHPVVSSHKMMGSLEAAWFAPKYLGATGLFVRASAGRNPLNIRFVEDRTEIIFGLMLDTSQWIGRQPP